ncbi:hypothetical protein EXIGLDRAFT_834261 [Exidia glandulosa HHB12029]|uniref:Uncharacterized protein n=1 Tax=Exidia glandulosa HHB12029 TaxID=1314781 RepID=A0A165JZ70_EXIGL|nr:hypothetical protein EXIGLDRAFT_834261 [Exidia glandulosa HHB12029]
MAGRRNENRFRHFSLLLFRWSSHTLSPTPTFISTCNMSAPTNTKPSFLSRIGAQARRVFHPRLSSHWGLATAADDDNELTNRTPTAPTPMSSPPAWARAAPPFTPLRAARPASPVLTHTPLTLSSLGSSSSTLSEWLEQYYHDQDNALRTPSGDNGDRILVKQPSDNVFESVVEASETLPPSPKSTSHHLLASSPRIYDDDDDDMDVTQDLEDHQMRSPPRSSRSPSPTSSVRGLPPSSPRGHDDDEDADNMDIAVLEVPAEQDAAAVDENMLDLAPAPAAPVAALPFALLEHPLADQDNARGWFVVNNPTSPHASTTSSKTPSSAFSPSDGLAPATLASVPSPALPAPAAIFPAPARAPSASRASRPSRPHLPLPAPVIGKRAHHDSDDEERVTKKMKAPPTPSATQPATQKLTKMERRAAFHVSKSAAAARAIHLADDVAPATEHMEVDEGAVAAPDTFDRDWTSGTPIANVAPAAVAAFFKRTTDISRIVVDWEDSLCVSVRTQWSGKGRFNQCVPDVLRHLNTMTTVLVLGDTVPDQHLDALEAATELDAEVLIIRVSGKDDAPLLKRKSTLLALRSLRQVFFVSVGCGKGTRHSVPWEDAHHLMDVVIRTERKPDVDHNNICIVGAGNHQKELRDVGFSL